MEAYHHTMPATLDTAGSDSLATTLLRLAPEPCIHFSEHQVHETLFTHAREFMDRLHTFYRDWQDETEIDLPVKQVFSQPQLAGDFRVMPCTIAKRKLKMVKIIGTNEAQKTVIDKICVGKAALIDYYDNHIYALFDVCALSSFRTAAISCLAFQIGRKNHLPTGLIGSGRIGFYTAYLLHHWCHVDQLHVHDPCPENRQRFAQLCHHYLPNLAINQCSKDTLLDHCSALFLATTADTAICNRNNSGHLQFISSVGADADNLSEIDASLLTTHQLVTDSVQSACLGDMSRWNNDGLLAQNLTELRTLHNMPLLETQKILFISTGVAVQDALTCQFIYQKRSQATDSEPTQTGQS
jgi:ornithine cyclodeaminase/alanine dehydrogenase-like protein (mu-crystallin family)